MASNQLTSLANVKSWANVTTTSDDVLLTRLIGSASRFILNYLNRPTLFQNVFNEVYDGVGQRALTLRHYPAVAVNSLLILGLAVTASTGAPNCGYILDGWDGMPPGKPQALHLYGYRFPHGAPQSIAVGYIAGFVVQSEPQTVPATPSQITPNAPYGNWAVDQGVTYANGTALTAVTANPTQGQYVPPNPTGNSPTLYYQFAAADANAQVLLSYSYVPADIEDACVALVGERYKYKNRIGEVSKSLGGAESMAYSQKDMPDYLRTLLQPYKRVVLV